MIESRAVRRRVTVLATTRVQSITHRKIEEDIMAKGNNSRKKETKKPKKDKAADTKKK